MRYLILIMLAMTAQAGPLDSYWASVNANAGGGSTVTSPQWLVAHWTFNAGNGYYQQDFSGNNHSLTQNNVNSIGIISNNAIWFDGINDGMRTVETGLMDGYNAMTISYWVNITTIANDGMLLGERISSASIRSECITASSLSIAYSRGAYQTPQVLNAIPSNTWTHICMQYNASASPSMSVYTNGVLAVSSTNAAPPLTLNAVWSVGYDAYFPARYCGGFFDDVRLYTNLPSPLAIYQEGRK